MARQATAVAKRVLRTKTEMLRVPLSVVELQEVAEQTYRIEGDLRSFYAHKKEVTADLKAKEEQLDTALARLGRLGRDKCEYRPVAVRVEADYRASKVYEIREDTGEVVNERAMNEQDRQATLFDGAPRGTAEKLGAEKCLDCGVAADQPSKGCDSCDHGRTKKAPAKKAGPAPLVWTEVEGTYRAEVEGGEYSILPSSGPKLSWNLSWVPRSGGSVSIGNRFKLADAKADCQKHAAGKAVAP